MAHEPKWRVLVVDDDEAIRELIREILESAGFVVMEADNGRTGGKAARESGPFDLVVTDILMPDEDGLELIQEVRRIAGNGPRPRILAISGGGSFAGPDLYLASAGHFGADLALAKPFAEDSLLRALAQLGFSVRSAKG